MLSNILNLFEIFHQPLIVPRCHIHLNAKISNICFSATFGNKVSVWEDLKLCTCFKYISNLFSIWRKKSRHGGDYSGHSALLMLRGLQAGFIPISPTAKVRATLVPYYIYILKYLDLERKLPESTKLSRPVCACR